MARDCCKVNDNILNFNQLIKDVLDGRFDIHLLPSFKLIKTADHKMKTGEKKCQEEFKDRKRRERRERLVRVKKRQK